MEEKKVGYIAVSEEDKSIYQSSEEYLKHNSRILNQAFKGEMNDREIKFPKELGAEHPFDFEYLEGIYKRIGIVHGAVNKITDSIIGDFSVMVDNPNSQAIIDGFINDSNFLANLRTWIYEGVLKGNGFLELDFKDNQVRVMNANNMYVKRKKSGDIIEYSQYKGSTNSFNYSKDMNKVIIFNPNQIAHLPLNKIPNDPYGIGYVWPSLVSINNYASSELDLHKLMSRKAGAPIHVKVGIPGEAVNPQAIDSFKTNLQYMNNRTEWVTDANAEMKVIDFSGVGDNLTKLSEHDIEQIAYGMNIPLVLLGKSNVPEGLAQVQEDTFNRFIDSIRTIVEDVIEEKIFRPLLRSNNLDETIEFTWEITSEEEKKNKLMVLSDTMKNPFISPALKAALEKEYALVLGLDDLVKTLPTPEEAEEEDEIRREEEEEIQQPEVPGAKPTANEKAELITESEIKSLSEEDVREMSIAKYVNITELAGFNYTDYLVKILQKLKVYKFDELAAKSDKDIVEGLLPKEDVNKLRIILKDGFRKNKTIREIENQIKSSIDLKDRVRIEEDGTSRLLLSKESRPLTIARSETVRLANLGLKDLYDDNGIKQFRYLAPLDERTCEICGGLNGQVFNLKDGTPGINMPNMHANCRCTIIGLVE